MSHPDAAPDLHDTEGAPTFNARVPLSEFIPGRQDITFTLVPATVANTRDYLVPLHADGSMCQQGCDCSGAGRTIVTVPVGLTATVGDWLWFGWESALFGVYRPVDD